MDISDDPAIKRQGQPLGNLVLDAMDPISCDLVVPRLKRISIHRGSILTTPSRPLRRAVFPITAVLSFAERIGRRRIPVITVGNEGMVGHWLAFGSDPIESDIVCDVSGEAWSMPAHDLTSVAVEHGVGASIAEVSHSFSVQLIQNVVCATVHHTLRQRCCRTLLELRLRLGDSFELTHESLASMLAASRPSVTREMHELAVRGAIVYERGHVHIRDRVILERGACPCVGVLRARRGRLTGDADPHVVTRPRPDPVLVRAARCAGHVARGVRLTDG